MCYIYRLIVLCCLGISVQLSANTEYEVFSQLVQKLPKGSVHSIDVQTVTGQNIYQSNAEQNLLPASTVKTITAIIALQVLGESFRFSTQLLASKPLSFTYQGDLALKFSGDPSFTREQLAALIAQLKSEGVKRIGGNIWLDNSAFQGYSRPHGVSWDDASVCFGAPVAAIILDRNCFYALLKPARKAEQLTALEYRHPEWGITVDNQITTVVAQDDKQHDVQACSQEVWPDSKQQYRLTGCMEADDKALPLSFAVVRPEEAAKDYVRRLLSQNKIKLDGDIKIGEPNKSFNCLVTESHSAPLPVLLDWMLEQSDNLYADSLLKTLGSMNQQSADKAGSFESGVQVVMAALEAQKAQPVAGRLVDGSGLSRYNLMSAADFVRILNLGWQLWGGNAPWLRQREHKAYWFKTGSMSGVNNIVGYAFPKGKPPVIFAVMVNGLWPESSEKNDDRRAFYAHIREWHDQFIEAVTQPVAKHRPIGR